MLTSSAIIEVIDARRKAGLASLAFFYFDFREEEKGNLRGLPSSLLAQLTRQSDSYSDILLNFYSEHAEGLRCPSDDALVECLKDLLSLPGLAPVYLIVDGLDECSNSSSAIPSPRAKILNLVEELVELRFPNLHICVTSRPEADIKDVLDPLISRSLSLHDATGQMREVEKYVRSVIYTHSASRRLPDETYDPTLRTLAYERTLREINEADWEFAHRMFQFVAVASRPLRVEELAELLAFDFNAGPIPKFHEGWRPEDPVDAVLSKCSGLFTIVDRGSPFETTNGGSLSELSYGPPPETDDNSGISPSEALEDENFPKGTDDGSRFGKVIQFSDSSVKEFLTSDHLAEETDIILRRYHVSTIPAHTLAAKACLGILLPLDEDVATNDSLAKWPLAKYAAGHWVNHARFRNVSRNVEDGMKQLFDPSKPHLARCFRICNPDRSPFEQRRQAESPLTPRGTPLHYAALWGFDFIVGFLITEHAQEVNSRSFANDMTPLHLASIHGHVEAARMLVEGGADSDAPNGDGMSPSDMAWAAGHVEVAGMLNEHGTDFTAQDENGNFIERGAGVTAQDKDGETPLHLASLMGRVEVALTLIERGADVTAQDKDGKTPLHLASQIGQAKVVRILIECGADVTAKDKVGKTPSHLASQHGKVEVGRVLMELGADVAARDNDGKTPLHLASQMGQVEVVRMLIERGADVTAKDKVGRTPSHLASQQGKVVVARLLMELGADMTAQRDDGETELVSTLSSSPGNRRSQNNARVDVKHGVDENAQNTDGSTPSHLASQGGLAAFKRVPVDHGDDPGKMPASESLPATSPTHSQVDLPIPDIGDKPVSESHPLCFFVLVVS